MRDAFVATGIEEADPVLTNSRRADLADYQANGGIGIAKRQRVAPRILAQSVVENLAIEDIACEVNVAGPGFINIRLSNDFLWRKLSDAISLERTDHPDVVVIDYSSPNLAKEMHVGHLRSTVIGDAMARIFEALGHKVVRQNHVGDWGTPFGQLVAQIREVSPELANAEDPKLRDLRVLVEHYRTGSEKYAGDKTFADAAREAVVQLQRGEPKTRALWRQVREASLESMRDLYRRLDIRLTDDDIRGESSYHDDLPSIIEALRSQGLATESDGALCVFPEGFKGKDGSPLPMLLQKSDGGYLYHTTDLAAVRYRTSGLGGNRLLYFTDARQIQHFEMLFAVSRLAGLAPDGCSLEHHPFGSVTDKQGRPFKSRTGYAVPLSELLDEAESRTRRVIAAKSPDLGATEAEHVIRTVAVGAIKYALLSKNLGQNYVFDWDAMLSLEGNTAPYLLYACSRIRSVLARAGMDVEGARKLSAGLWAWTGQERALALELLRCQETLDQVATDVRPHFLCNYLYELTSKFMRFYEHCPILGSSSDVRNGRLKLAANAAQTLESGLGCLGISTVPRM